MGRPAVANALFLSSRIVFHCPIERDPHGRGQAGPLPCRSGGGSDGESVDPGHEAAHLRRIGSVLVAEHREEERLFGTSAQVAGDEDDYRPDEG